MQVCGGLRTVEVRRRAADRMVVLRARGDGGASAKQHQAALSLRQARPRLPCHMHCPGVPSRANPGVRRRHPSAAGRGSEWGQRPRQWRRGASAAFAHLTWPRPPVNAWLWHAPVWGPESAGRDGWRVRGMGGGATQGCGNVLGDPRNVGEARRPHTSCDGRTGSLICRCDCVLKTTLPSPSTSLFVGASPSAAPADIGVATESTG